MCKCVSARMHGSDLHSFKKKGVGAQREDSFMFSLTFIEDPQISL